jgi:hypothetical protein
MCLRSLIFSCTHTHFLDAHCEKLNFIKGVFFSLSHTKKYLPKHQGVHAVIYCTKQHLSDAFTYTHTHTVGRQNGKVKCKQQFLLSIFQRVASHSHGIIIIWIKDAHMLTYSHLVSFEWLFICTFYSLLSPADDTRVQSNVIK